MMSGDWGARREPSTAVESSSSEGRHTIGTTSNHRTIAAAHLLSVADGRLLGLGTRRRVPTVDIGARTPQSVLLPPSCRTCAALLDAIRSSAPGQVSLRPPPGTMRSAVTDAFHVCGH